MTLSWFPTREVPVDLHGGVLAWPVQTGLPLVDQHPADGGRPHVLLRLVSAKMQRAVGTVHRMPCRTSGVVAEQPVVRFVCG